MTKRLEICIDDDLGLTFFEVSEQRWDPEPKWFRSSLTPKQIHRIIDLLTLVANDPKKQDGPLPQDEPIKSKPKPMEPEDVTLTLPTEGTPKELPLKIQARDFARGLLERGVSGEETHKQTIEKFGSVVCRMGRWRGWCNTWRLQGLLPDLPTRPALRKEAKPDTPTDHLVCKRVEISHLSAADCLDFQCRWQFSTASPTAAWDKLKFCRTCTNEKKRPDLEALSKTKCRGSQYNARISESSCPKF